jgi:hypothetical protein
MNRRSFFATIAGTLAAVTLDPEKLLWIPGKKLISIPSTVRSKRAYRDYKITAVSESYCGDVLLSIDPCDDWKIVPMELITKGGWSRAEYGLQVGDVITIAGVYA